MKRLSALLLLASLSSGCYLSTNSIVVDGVKLEEKHEEVLEVEQWSSLGLTVGSAQGDIRIEPAGSDGANVIEVVIHERVLGDGYAVLEGEKLVSKSKSGDPTAIGKVIVRTNLLPRVHASTGMGDVTIVDVSVTDSVQLDTGMGDIDVSNAGSPKRLHTHTGMGDIEVARTSCGDLVAESGMGDVEVLRVLAEKGVCSSGMGDVELDHCSFGQIDASTGMGDVDCIETTYDKGDFDSGLGKVTKKTTTEDLD